MRWIIAAASAFLFFLAPSPALAWGESGHYAVCEIAYLNLTPTARAEVDRLIAVGGGYESFTESCTFPDKPRQRASEHFANYSRSAPRVPGPDCPGGRPCIIEAIAGDLAVLRSPSASDDDKSKALKFIGHWYGDIHQPLHISFADDQGGNLIDQRGPCQFSLHSVWDTCIVERRLFGAGSDRLARARAAAATLNAGITARQRLVWRQSAPWRWAAESYQVSRRATTGYCVQKPGSCWYSATEQTYASNDPKRVHNVDNAYLDWAKPIVADRLRRAGIRLAHSLNKSFDPEYGA
ncbi:MAG TPA: S1/P1 nuclease [Phenylobacterium sp.]|nr:S1/P1 nuclease [Phenylobacterium sp.]